MSSIPRAQFILESSKKHRIVCYVALILFLPNIPSKWRYIPESDANDMSAPPVVKTESCPKNRRAATPAVFAVGKETWLLAMLCVCKNTMDNKINNKK